MASLVTDSSGLARGLRIEMSSRVAILGFYDFLAMNCPAIRVMLSGAGKVVSAAECLARANRFFPDFGASLLNFLQPGALHIGLRQERTIIAGQMNVAKQSICDVSQRNTLLANAADVHQ
jgi:hypothetical protein